MLYITRLHVHICCTLPDNMLYIYDYQITCTPMLYITRLYVHACCTLLDYMYTHVVHYQIICTPIVMYIMGVHVIW